MNTIISLKNAKNEYKSKNYFKSLEIFDQLFNENPEAFDKNDLISYCWAIYQVNVKNFTDEDQLFDAVEFITELIPQADLNQANTCPYIFSIFIVLDYLRDGNTYYNMAEWLDKLNPNLLDDKRNAGSKKYSRKEQFYVDSSKAFLESAEWDLCIQISKEALNSLNEFTFDGDVWFKWRIAKSLKELHQNEEALKYLDEVVKVKKDWFVFKEIAENYYFLNENEKALENICNAILTNDSVRMKVNLYYLAFKLLEDSDPEIAYRHGELFYLLKSDTNSEIPDEIEDLLIDDGELDKNELIKEIEDYWTDFKFKDKELHYGTVSKFFNQKNFGFIMTDDDESIFFHKNEFKGDNVYVGQLVSFFTEKSFDKSKNKESVKAINVRGE